MCFLNFHNIRYKLSEINKYYNKQNNLDYNTIKEYEDELIILSNILSDNDKRILITLLVEYNINNSNKKLFKIILKKYNENIKHNLNNYQSYDDAFHKYFIF